MPPSSPDETRNAFSFICQQFAKRFDQGDAEGLASLYSEDAKVLPPNMDIIEGKDPIRAYWQGALDMGVKSFKGDVIETASTGDLGYLIGKYTLYDKDNQEVDQGKWISVLKNIDGNWKVHRDIFNTSITLEQK